jgi:hypothetical protein
MTATTSTQEWSPATTPEADRHALAGEHALLLRDLRRRVDPVQALIAAKVRPHAELATLIRFVRTDVLRQASDEEVLLYPSGATAPFTELSAEHVRLHALADSLELADRAPCSLAELGRLVKQLVQVLEHHLVAEQAALTALADVSAQAPATADVRSGARVWLDTNDNPVLIRLDALPRERAVQMCIERLLRLRVGQSADVHSSRAADLQQVRRWMQDFDTTGYGFAQQPSAHDSAALRVTRRPGR